MSDRAVTRRSRGIGVLVIDCGEGQRLVARFGASATAEHGSHPHCVCWLPCSFDNNIAALSNLSIVSYTALRT